MFSKMDIPPGGVNIVRRFGPALSDILESKFGCVATFDGVDFEGDPSVAQQRRPTPDPEKRFGVSLPAGVQVSVVKADLANFQVDAVVNAANERLQHYGGLALALSSAGGPKIQQDSDDFIRRNGSLNTGDAVVMDAGFLPCKKIIHAVGPYLPPNPYQYDIDRAEPLLKQTIRSILDRVQENRLQSVAIPAISSGLFHFPLPLCADTIVSTVKRYYERASGHRPKEILLVNNDEPTVKEMERACCQMLGPHSSMNYSQAVTVTGKTRGGAKMSPLTVQMGNVNLTLRKGKIEEQQTGVIVNTTYDRDLSKGQISCAVLQKAGSKMQADVYAAPKTGNVIITRPYNLRCKEVYHAFCTRREEAAAPQVLYSSVSECLWNAASNGHRSIAFPAIGTGGLGFSKREAAQIMLNAVTQFAQAFPEKMEVHFVIFHSDDETFKAFEEQMRSLQQMTSQPSSTHVEPREEFRGSRAPHPQISLRGPSMEAIEEAQQWLQDLLFKFSGSVVIRNNFILHLGEKEQLQLSRLMETGVNIEESFERGHASIIVGGESHEDVVVAGLQVEAMLCNIQKEFVREEESAILMMLVQKDISFKRTPDFTHPMLSDRMSAFKHHRLQVVKVDKVENATLRMLFDMKKKQLNCFTTQKMFQRIPAQFCEMVSHIGFHAEYAPPDDAAYGEGIYFTRSVKKAMEVWKVVNKEKYLHFVEAEVLIGDTTPGKPGLILPPAKRKDPQVLYDSVSGGQEVSVIFSGYQALPMNIITCRAERFREYI